MTLKMPESMDECIYFTRRADKGKIIAWVKKQLCPKCKKGLMVKPVDEKTGKPKIRAKEYVCPECGNTVEKAEHEAELKCEIIYTCPNCGKNGETVAPYKRKTFQGVPAIVFQCEHCNEKIGITKKMKATKKKGKGGEEADDDDF
jgi:ribosomal protein S27AE